MRGIDELTEVDKMAESETSKVDIEEMIKAIYDFIVGGDEKTEEVDEKEEVIEDDKEEKIEE